MWEGVENFKEQMMIPINIFIDEQIADSNTSFMQM